MYEHNASQGHWNLNTQQHVNLEKHQQMIENSLRWQEVSERSDDQQQAAAKPLRTRLANLLYLVMSSFR